jgi:hypothetical protein
MSAAIPVFLHGMCLVPHARFEGGRRRTIEVATLLCVMRRLR